MLPLNETQRVGDDGDVDGDGGDPICAEDVVKFSTKLNALCFAFKWIPLTTQHTDLLKNGSLQDPSAY